MNNIDNKKHFEILKFTFIELIIDCIVVLE